MDRKREGEDPLYGYKREDYKVSASVSRHLLVMSGDYYSNYALFFF